MVDENFDDYKVTFNPAILLFLAVFWRITGVVVNNFYCVLYFCCSNCSLIPAADELRFIIFNLLSVLRRIYFLLGVFGGRSMLLVP